jgi:hypothetical protein
MMINKAYKDTSGDVLAFKLRRCEKANTGKIITVLDITMLVDKDDTIEFESVKKVRQMSKTLLQCAKKMTRPFLFLLLSCLCLAADPNIVNIQLWRTPTGFFVIEEHTPRVIKYISTDPNKAADFSWAVKNAKTYQMNCVSALHYITFHWDKFCKSGIAMDMFNNVSQGWTMKIIEPNVPQEPNKPADPCNIDPNLLDILAGVTDPNLLLLFNSLLKEQP